MYLEFIRRSTEMINDSSFAVGDGIVGNVLVVRIIVN